MKRKILASVIRLLVIALIIPSCQKQPEACIEVISPLQDPILTRPAVYVCDPIQFKDCSKDAYHHTWDFGDGTTSNEVNPTHTYYDVWTHEVTLTVTSKNGKLSSETMAVVEVLEPSAKFIGVYSVSGSYTGLCEPGTPYNLTIMWGGATGVLLNNFASSFNNVLASVECNKITIPAQTYLQNNKTGNYWDFDGGFGEINDGTLTWTYSINDALHANQCGSIDASETAIQQ